MEYNLEQIINMVSDIVFIIAIITLCAIVYVSARKINRISESAKRTVEKVENITDTVSDSAAKSGGFISGVVRALGALSGTNSNKDD